MTGRRPSAALVALGLCAVFAFVVKLTIAVSSYGSTDVLLFEADAAKIERDGALALYRDGVRTEWCGAAGQRPCPPFNHPPLIVLALRAWAGLADVSGLPLGFWLRVTSALADVGTFVVLFLLCRTCNLRQGGALLLFTASPIAILLSGFHGNTDPVMIFFVVLSVWLIDTRRPASLAGLTFGVAASVKLLPLFLVPMFLLSMPDGRQRLAFAAGASLIPLVSSLPLVLVDPAVVGASLFGYSPQSGIWGLSVLAVASQGGNSLSVYESYARYGRLVTLVVVAAASVWLYFRAEQRALGQRIGFIISLLLASAPGFGVQYLAWLVPFVVALGVWPTAIYYLSGTMFLSAYYSAAAGPFPWYVANTLEHPAWNGTVVALGLLCWGVVCYLTLLHVRAELTRNSN